GAGARDVFSMWSQGYDMVGVDAIVENIEKSRNLHPEIADRVFVADLRQPLPFEDASFDFVACNAVIQHIEPDLVRDVVLPELTRVLRPEGVLQLMHKNGTGTTTVFDKDYGVERTFQLHDEREMLGVLQERGMALIEAESPDTLGGFLYFTDPKPVDHCLFFTRKVGTSS
ncbi:MAG: class I SAM-dependent methyltransferase, partial [Dehalococcoidia bacterium]|nr:class I SAM-dependent methyltransferase [Dehalococcoidia bacterium]